MDALVLFEAGLLSMINRLTRRPYDLERPELIRSGSVFIYDEGSSGIKRWTDGRHWSPGRVLGNFLVYRELEAPLPQGTARKIIGQRKAPYSARRDPGNGKMGAEYALVGPLVDSYPFKPSGLVKKTMKVIVNDVSHHLVSYYTLEDLECGRLITPSDSAPRNIIPRAELEPQGGFRYPVDQERDKPNEESEWYSVYHDISEDAMLTIGNLSMFYSVYSDASLSTRSPLATILGQEISHQYFDAADGFHPYEYFNSEGRPPHGGFASLQPSVSTWVTNDCGPPQILTTTAGTWASTCNPALAYPPHQGSVCDDRALHSKDDSGGLFLADFTHAFQSCYDFTVG